MLLHLFVQWRKWKKKPEKKPFRFLHNQFVSDFEFNTVKKELSVYEYLCKKGIEIVTQMSITKYISAIYRKIDRARKKSSHLAIWIEEKRSSEVNKKKISPDEILWLQITLKAHTHTKFVSDLLIRLDTYNFFFSSFQRDMNDSVEVT